MDISEQYIKMCEKAEEIQKPAEGWTGGTHISGNIYFYVGSTYAKQRGIPDGYYYFLDETFEGEVCDNCGHKEDDRHRTVKSIWLPRQDQLQEMLELWRYCSNEVSSLAWGVWNFYTHADDNYYPDSMEQLWLAFIMAEKFSKRWSGEEWLTRD